MSATYDRSMNENSDVPAGYAVAVTPNDSTDLTYTTRALYIGGTGNVALITQDGQTVTFVACQVGTILPVKASRVLSTGTTATSIVALS